MFFKPTATCHCKVVLLSKEKGLCFDLVYLHYDLFYICFPLTVPYKFVYFQVRGKAHHIRYLLEDNEVAYEEPHITKEEWFAKIKPTMRFGQLPCLQDGDLELVQSGAIGRHLARKHGVYGETIEEAARIDMIHDGMVDLRDKLLKTIFTQTDYEAAKKAFIDALPGELAKFEDLLKENNGGSGYFVGNKVSLADYSVFDLALNQSAYAPGCLDQCPLLTAFVERMQARPNLKKYMEGEKHKSMKITISDRLL